MEKQRQVTKQVRIRILLLMALLGFVVGAAALGVAHFTDWPLYVTGLVVAFLVTQLAALFAFQAARYAMGPFNAVQQAIAHISPSEHGQPAPDLTKLQLGHELVAELINQVHQFASNQDGPELAAHRQTMIQATNIVSHLPLPLFVFNKSQVVVSASDAALIYCQLESSKLFGKPLYESLSMEFSSEGTLENWVKSCATDKVTDTAYWQRVRVRLPDGTMHQCDMAAYYNKDNPSGTEFIVTLFDRTEQYNNEDQDLSFASLAVHELRTPLTMLRGYIEVFEDELGPVLNPEMTDFLNKMNVSANQLATFFNNILNVARVEQDQLALHLIEGDWTKILTDAINELNLKAQVHGRKLHLQIAPGIPTVGVDKISIIEVINNLVDNAIKYSKEQDTIEIAVKPGENGLVETSVTDHGQGIPVNVMQHLFEKFYRNHRTASKVGGTGLGLYLSRAIIKAHGGEIWVNSKEGQGATVGFSIVPYSQLAATQKTGNNTDIVREAHGWIKNHSMYRR